MSLEGIEHSPWSTKQTYGAPSLRTFVCSWFIERWLVRDVWYPAPITCAGYDIHRPTPPLEVVSWTTGLNCNGMEPGRLHQ
ncbi:hypothetical protein TNCV_5113251 [Trichonephila clavipes]|nr:hypothetical protein TNCV_5113251 [Trichonephila clavipes]